MNMLPPFSGLKCVGSGIGFFIYESYEEVNYDTDGKE
jgi:hypothetical protein